MKSSFAVDVYVTYALRMFGRPQIYQLIAAMIYCNILVSDRIHISFNCCNSPELDAGQSDPQVESVPAVRAGPC